MRAHDLPSLHVPRRRSAAGALLALALAVAACSSDDAVAGPTGASQATTADTAPVTTTTAAPTSAASTVPAAPSTAVPSTAAPVTSTGAAYTRSVVETAARRSWTEGETTAVDELWSPGFVGHTAAGDHGVDAVRDAAAAAAQSPDGRPVVAVTLVDGDTALVVSTDGFTGAGRVEFELLRVADGLIVESWQAVAALAPAPNPSGHTQTDGLTAATDHGREDANIGVVEGYLQTGLVEGRWEDIDQYFDGNTYVQHSTIAADGVDSVRSFFVGLRDGGSPFTYAEVHVVLAEGDHVLTVSRGDYGGTTSAYWDLWRLADGVIAEHWDVIEAVPAERADPYFAALPDRGAA